MRSYKIGVVSYLNSKPFLHGFHASGFDNSHQLVIESPANIAAMLLNGEIDLGERMGIASSYIRLFFIYTTFISPASPIIVYLVLAFWLDMKKYMQAGRKFFVD